MEYYRNSKYHRIGWTLLSGSEGCIGGYTAEEYEVIIIVKYPLHLTGMQEALHDEKQLEGF